MSLESRVASSCAPRCVSMAATNATPGGVGALTPAALATRLEGLEHLINTGFEEVLTCQPRVEEQAVIIRDVREAYRMQRTQQKALVLRMDALELQVAKLKHQLSVHVEDFRATRERVLVSQNRLVVGCQRLSQDFATLRSELRGEQQQHQQQAAATSSVDAVASRDDGTGAEKEEGEEVEEGNDAWDVLSVSSDASWQKPDPRY